MNLREHGTGTGEIHFLNVSDDNVQGYGRYSRSIVNQLREFRKFSRYNSTLFILVGAIMLVVLGATFIYYFYEEAVELLPDFITNPNESENYLKILEPQHTKCDSSLHHLKMEVISSSDNFNKWTNLTLDCEEFVTELRISGCLSFEDVQSFSNKFSHLEKLRIVGPELCNCLSYNSSNVGSETELIFQGVKHLIISNTTLNCNQVFEGLLQNISNLVELDFDQIVYNARIGELLQTVLVSHKISNVTLKNLTY